ncbi:hypothetical protein FQN51_002031 [Onygenales sp. PD_10]|nr:hypothetical protein FQN51_002031 [Onygenales sp. PD_10]
MNQMNVGGMNPGAGGPVGGIPMMNNGSSAPRSEPTPNNPFDMPTQLNTYIYDYFIKRGHYDLARALVQDESFKLTLHKQSPSHHGEMNGVDGDVMATDSKEDVKTRIPDDLPRPNFAQDQQPHAFLLEWFGIFWEIFMAQRKRSRNSDATQYVQHTQAVARYRDQQNSMRQPQMMPGHFMRAGRGGMLPANIQKNIMQNSQNMSPQQIAQLQKSQQQQLLHHQMQREPSEMEMNGHRPQSPSSVENAPSPSKRPRLDGSQVNGLQMAPNGRGQGQGMQGRPNQQTNTTALLMQHGINPNTLTPTQFHAFQAQNPSVQAKSLQVYNQNMAIQNQRSGMNNQAMQNGLMNPNVMPNQGDIMPQMHDGSLMPIQDYFPGNGQMQQMRPGMQTPGAGPGNHALQDYQMQLMLLEQQNKRRLLMARQEQDSISRGDGPPGGMPGQPTLPPGTSPQGSRTGASPNPNDQMKRGTPKMNQPGLPGSPSVGDAMAQGRSSPASMNFGGGPIPQEMAGGAAFFMKNMPEGVVANGMRPPSSNPAFTGPQMAQPMDTMSRPQGAGGNRMPSGNWPGQGPQGQPMMPQQPVGQPQPAGTPQERNAMPPPQAPPGGVAGTQRTQPSSPQPGAAPPTPQQSTKPAPKGKKEPKENQRKRPPKKSTAANAANTAATPSSEAEPPPTPTPPTPITPVHPNSFNNKTSGNATTNAPQPTSAPAPQNLAQPQQDPQSYNDLTVPDGAPQHEIPGNFELSFASLENPDILENFDFDTFLNTDDGGFTFDPNHMYTDAVEAGAGDTM